MIINNRKAFIWMLAFVFIPQLVYAQAQEVQYDVTFVAMDEASGFRLRRAGELLVNALESRGARRNKQEGWLFLIGVSEPNEENEVALSITTLYKLPESVVQMGKREQVFYKAISEQDPSTYPEEGREVREYMSEEYMRQFAAIQGNYVEIAAESDLEEKIEGIVDQFYRRHVHRGEE